MNEEIEEDEPLTPEEQARCDTVLREAETAWEAESTATYGPPEACARKNERYVARLIRRHSEATVRGLLRGLSTLKEPISAAHLAHHDLDGEPLEDIIRPFELFGFHFRVTNVCGPAYTVEFGSAYGTCGSGGTFVLARTESGSFHVTEEVSQWIA